MQFLINFIRLSAPECFLIHCISMSTIDWYSAAVGAVAVTVVLPTLWFVTKSTIRFIQGRLVQRRYQVVCANKRRDLAKLVEAAKTWSQNNQPTKGKEGIQGVSLTELQQKLRKKEVSAVQLLAVFLGNAVRAHEATNCLSWIMLDDAIEAAKQADAIINRSDENELRSKPLLGIPISIKEMLACKGTDCTLGLIGRAFDPTEDDSGSVRVLREQGANIFVKTSVPVLLMSFECESSLFGVTTNPHDASRTPGGSSGGEGALLALHGAAAGVGTDIGGSIRIPSAFCGTVGLKPTFLRVSGRGNRVIRGDESIPTITGPMGRTVGDVAQLFRCLTTAPTTDKFLLVDGMCAQVPFRQQLFDATLSKKVLRIGYYEHDGFIDTSPACARAVRVAIEALKQAGHVVVPFRPPQVEETVSVFYELVGADGAENLRNILGFDVAFGVVKPLLQFCALPYVLKKLVAILVVSRQISPNFAAILLKATEKRVVDYGRTLVRRNECRHAYADAFNAQNLDAVICPGFYIPPPKCGSTTRFSFGAGMTLYYNVLDLPVLTMPVTNVSRSLDAWESPPNNGMSRCMKGLYDSEAMHGLPVGVQIVTPKFTEEVALAIGQRLEGLVKAAR